VPRSDGRREIGGKLRSTFRGWPPTSQSRQRWYLAVLVIRTNFRHHQGSVAVFGSTSKAPVSVTHSEADYTTLRPGG